MSRLTLPNGDWADFDTRLNYAQARRIREVAETFDAEATFIAALVKGWALRDVEDQPIEFPERAVDGIPLEALGRVPFDTFQAMALHAGSELENVPDPKGTGGTSRGSQPARQSASRRTSTRPTSSSTIQDGATPTFKPPLPI